MLKTNNNLRELTNRVYSETLGDPKYIKAIINELYSSELLYFNVNNGIWEYNIEHKETLIPKELKEKLEGYLSELNQDDISV